MKSLLSIKKWREAKRAKKPVKLPKDSLFKDGEIYPLFISDEPINENDPFFIESMEAAKKSLKESGRDGEAGRRLQAIISYHLAFYRQIK